MSQKPALIKEILSKHTVKHLLAERGYTPDRDCGNKTFYNCPLPGHDDATPSFCVYDDGDTDRYHCFGCGRSGDSINLYQELESVSLRDAIHSLGKGIKVDFSSDFEIAIKALEDYKSEEDIWDIDTYSLMISVACYKYLSSVKFYFDEVVFIESVLEKVDQAVEQMDKQSLVGIYDIVVDRLHSRLAAFLRDHPEYED